MTFNEALRKAGLPSEVALEAVSAEYHRQILSGDACTILSSVDLDTHFCRAEPHAPRWDYGIGLNYKNVDYAIWIEPHGLTTGREVSKVIRKLSWLREKLNSEGWEDVLKITTLTQRNGFAPFLWILPPGGRVTFRPGAPNERKLRTAGLTLPKRAVKLPIPS